MTIAIFFNPQKSQAEQVALGISHYLSKKGVVVLGEDSVAKTIEAKSLKSFDPTTIDCSICLGGDGSILRLVHRHPELHAPIFGINMGSLGFLADTPLSEVYSTLDDYLAGKFEIQERLMMDGFFANNEECFAVNEIVIHRAQNPSLIDLAIFVDGKYLNTFSADGVIFSTATGSTAYSLAAGGPILTPEVKAFTITPISPHTISNRAIVLMPSSEIRVDYISKHHPIDVIADGLTTGTLSTGQSFTIRLSKRSFRLVNMFQHDFYSTLRTKLGWSGKLRQSYT